MIYGSRPRGRSNGVPFLAVALATAGVACGDPSNNPNGISTGGTSAGRGGGASTAGRSGSAGSATGGSAGAVDSSDAGVAGGGSAGESGSAGEGGSGGESGAGGRPAGCPEPNPIPVAGQGVVIQSINLETSEIVLRNAVATPQTINLGRQGWQWCAFPRYWSFEDRDVTLELAPGETYSFVAINNQSEVLQLLPEEGEMAIYPAVQVFDDYETVQSFVAWGDVQAYRESYAVQKGVWTFGERIEIAPGHDGFIVTGETNLASGYTSAPARCLVP